MRKPTLCTKAEEGQASHPNQLAQDLLLQMNRQPRLFGHLGKLAKREELVDHGETLVTQGTKENVI